MKTKNLFSSMSKCITFLLIGVMSIFAVGCKNGGDDSSSSGDNTVVEKPSNEPYVDYNIDYSTVVGNLVKDDKSAYSIVYGENAGLAVQQAAKELQDYIMKATGVYIKTTTDVGMKYSTTSKVISLGQNKLLSESDLTLDYSLLKNDGYFIKTENESIFLTGKTDRGTLYSAYEFLEEFVGVKFLAYDYTYVPEKDVLELYKTDITDNPAFNERTFLANKTMTDGQFASRMRMVNEFVTIDERYGGGIGWFKDLKYISNHVHNTLSYVEPNLYYADHNDWFFVENGEVLDLHYSNLGITEDGHVDETLEISPVKVAIEKLKLFIQNSTPDIKYFMIGQMDEHASCKCAKCEEDIAKYERSGMNIRFVNAMDEAIEKWMKEEDIDREIYLCTFAYQYSQAAPVDESGKPLDPTVIPRDNVIVRIAPIQADNYYSMTDERQNDRTRNMFLQWSNVAKKTMIWSYHTIFSHYLGYYPTMHNWSENLKLYQQMGTQYVFMQSDHNEANDFKAIMETYVASKMLWNPNLNANEVRNEFIQYYYAGVSDLVIDYLDNFETNYAFMMSREDRHDNTNQSGKAFLDTKYYSVAFFDTQFGLIDEMLDRVEKGDLIGSEKEKFVKRVERLKLNPLYMVLYNYDYYYFNDEAGKKAMQTEFFTLCSKLGVVQYAENKTITSLKNLWGYTG